MERRELAFVIAILIASAASAERIGLSSFAGGGNADARQARPVR
jgi:hypothetical protein